MARTRFKREWPAWRYSPDGKGRVFEKEEDVPEGWTATRPKPDDPIESVTIYLDRQQIIDDLLEKGIVADPRWAAVRLKELLDTLE